MNFTDAVKDYERYRQYAEAASNEEQGMVFARLAQAAATMAATLRNVTMPARPEPARAVVAEPQNPGESPWWRRS